MFGLFGRKSWREQVDELNANTMAMVNSFNAKADMEKWEYEHAISIKGVRPSVEGNKVIFYDREAANRAVTTNGLFALHFGSVGLEGNKKIFKNQFGDVERIEIFKSLSCRLTYS